MLIYLTQEEEADVWSTIESHAAVHDTARAVGVALEWIEMGCPTHAGERVPFEVEAKHNMVAPLKLTDPGLERPNVQTIISSMTAELASATSEVDLSKPFTRRRSCCLCREAGLNPKLTAQKVALEAGGPSHFFALVPQKHEEEYGSERRRDSIGGVDPSFELEAFGSLYMLCAVIYREDNRFDKPENFLTQVYLPVSRAWITYDDQELGMTMCGPEFNASFFRGAEYMFLYVSNSAVQEAGCLVNDAELSDETTHEFTPGVRKSERPRREV